MTIRMGEIDRTEAMKDLYLPLAWKSSHGTLFLPFVDNIQPKGIAISCESGVCSASYRVFEVNGRNFIAYICPGCHTLLLPY